MGRLGSWEVILVVVIILIVFGPMMIPWIGRQIGEIFHATKELKDSLPSADDFKDDKDTDSSADKKK